MTRTLFVVRRLSWTPEFTDGCFLPAKCEDTQAGVPVRAFGGRAEAEAFCREREAAARHLVAPGRILGSDILDDAGEVSAALGRLGLRPPAFRAEYVFGDDLLRWWEAVAADATPDQRAGVWEALGVRFYDVVEVPLEG